VPTSFVGIDVAASQVGDYDRLLGGGR
jgi:hypothetical protein